MEGRHTRRHYACIKLVWPVSKVYQGFLDVPNPCHQHGHGPYPQAAGAAFIVCRCRHFCVRSVSHVIYIGRVGSYSWSLSQTMEPDPTWIAIDLDSLFYTWILPLQIRILHSICVLYCYATSWLFMLLNCLGLRNLFTRFANLSKWAWDLTTIALPRR